MNERSSWLVREMYSGILGCPSPHKSPPDASSIKWAEQEHIRAFGLYLARCGLWIGTVLGLRLMTFHKSTRTQVRTSTQIEKQFWAHLKNVKVTWSKVKLSQQLFFQNLRLNCSLFYSIVKCRNSTDTNTTNWNTHRTVTIQEMYNLPIISYYEGWIWVLKWNIGPGENWLTANYLVFLTVFI